MIHWFENGCVDIALSSHHNEGNSLPLFFHNLEASIDIEGRDRDHDHRGELGLAWARSSPRGTTGGTDETILNSDCWILGSNHHHSIISFENQDVKLIHADGVDHVDLCRVTQMMRIDPALWLQHWYTYTRRTRVHGRSWPEPVPWYWPVSRSSSYCVDRRDIDIPGKHGRCVDPESPMKYCKSGIIEAHFINTWIIVEVKQVCVIWSIPTRNACIK